MYYYIDGYNFLFRIYDKIDSLEIHRGDFIEIMNKKLSFLKGRCSLVFDSDEQIRDSPQCAFLENLEVIYTPKNMTADAYIIELTDSSSNPKALTIVTSDSGLARQCSSLGAHVVTIETFMAFISKKTTPFQEEKSDLHLSDKELERLRKIFEKRLDF